MPLPEHATLPAALRAAGLLEGPPLARAAARVHAAAKGGVAALEHLRQAWLLGLHEGEILDVLVEGARGPEEVARTAAILRDRAVAAALSGTAEAFLHAALACQCFALTHGLPAWEGWLAHALPLRLPPLPLPPRAPGPPLLLHVVPCPLDAASPLPALPLEVAALHRHPGLRVRVFVPAPRAAVAAANPALLALAEALGLDLAFSAAAPSGPVLPRLLRWHAEVAAMGAACACFHYATLDQGFLAALRPAPLVAGVDYGDPDRFAPPFLDLCFATHPHGAMEARCPTLFLPLGLTRRHAGTPGTLPRAALGLPEGVPLLMTSGSPGKLRAPALRAVLEEVLREAPALHALILGDAGIAAPPGLEARWHARPRSEDFAAVVALCDVYLDTVPEGGGFALAEAMRQGRPCAMAHHDHGRPFDRRAGFGAFAALAPDPAIAVPPGDWPALAARVLELLADPVPQLARQAALLPLVTDPAPQVARMAEAILDRLAAGRTMAAGGTAP